MSATPPGSQKKRKRNTGSPTNGDAGTASPTGSDSGRMTPTRKLRVEEKLELQDLNKRLELYILKQRERDASQGTLQRELEVLKEHFESEKRNMKARYESQIKALRKTREEQATVNAALMEEKSRADNLIAQLRGQLQDSKSRQTELEIRCDQLQKDLNLARNKLFSAEEDAKSLGHELDVERSKVHALSMELDAERKRADDASAEASAALSRIKNLEDDLEMLTLKNHQEVAQYQEQIAELTKSREAIEEELRREFGQQLKDILAARQAQYEEEKNAGLAELKLVYDEKIKQYRDALDHAGEELDSIKEKHRIAIQAESDTLRKIHRSELSKMKDIIASLRDAYKRKDEEFDALMDVKVALAMEIKAYRMLLENEEDRLGISPSKKPVVNDVTSSLLIGRMDIAGRYITIRNGSTETISLRGWSLRSLRTESEFKFPSNVALVPGKAITVWTGADSKSKEKGTSDVAWVGDNVWDKNGDEVLLVDPTDKTISKVQVSPNAAT